MLVGGAQLDGRNAGRVTRSEKRRKVPVGGEVVGDEAEAEFRLFIVLIFSAFYRLLFRRRIGGDGGGAQRAGLEETTTVHDGHWRGLLMILARRTVSIMHDGEAEY